MFSSRFLNVSLLLLVVLGIPVTASAQTSFNVPFTYQVGGTVPASVKYNVFNPTPVSLTLHTDSATWVSASLSSNSTPSVLTIAVTPTGLAPGSYNSTITVDSSVGSLIFAVSLTVTGASSVGLTLNPTTLNFTGEAGGAAPANQSLSVTAQASTSATIQVSKQSCASANWLSISPSGNFTAGPTATIFSVSVDQSGLTAGTVCAGTVTVTTATSNQTTSVNLTVTSPVRPGLTFSATSFTFSAAVGAAPPSALTLSVSAGTSTSAIAQASEQTCTASNWLSLTPSGNFTASPTVTTFSISVNQAGLAAGTTCTGVIQVTASTGTQTIPVTLNVIAVPSARVNVSPSQFTFAAVSGGSAPPGQTLTVTADFSTSASIKVTKQSCASANWLTVAPSADFTASPSPTTITVSVNPSGINAPSTCAGAVLIVAGVSTYTVPITLNVTAGAVNSLTVSSSLFLFNAPAGSPPPNAKSLTVSAPSNISATLQVSPTTCSSANWLSVSPSGNFTAGPVGSSFSISVDQSGMIAGTLCTGTLSVTWATGTQTIDVAMFVTTPAGGSVGVSAAPTTMTFNYAVGDPNPATQVLAVSGSGSPATFTATATSSGWLRISQSCTLAAPCTTPNSGTFNLQVTADPTGLNAGTTYRGTVVIAGTGQATGTTMLNVSLTVTAPVPAISLVTNGASFLAGPIAPGEMIAIFGSASAPIGPTTALRLDDRTCPSPCTNVPTSMGGVQVVFQPGGIVAPLVFVSSTQINCMVPYEVQGSTTGKIEVIFLGQRSASVPVQYVATQPGVFTALGTGSGLASVQQYDPSGAYRGQNSSANPAEPGWTLSFYATGEGIIPAPAVTGKITTGGPVVPLLGPPTLLIDNLSAKIDYFSEADGLVAGMLQVNAIVPAGVHSGQVPFSLAINGNGSQPNVFVFIK